MLKKTPLGQVLGLGSAKSGTEHWWQQRVSAIAGIPLVVFLIGYLLDAPRRLPRRDRGKHAQSLRGDPHGAHHRQPGAGTCGLACRW